MLIVCPIADGTKIHRRGLHGRGPSYGHLTTSIASFWQAGIVRSTRAVYSSQESAGENVRLWHLTDISITRANVRFQGKSGRQDLTPRCPLWPKTDSRVVNFIQISIVHERTLSLTEPSAQSGRPFNFLTGTQPGVRYPRSETCRRKETSCSYLESCKESR